MKLKLVSDGTKTGTKLIDEDTGEMVHGVSRVSWEADAKEHITKTTVEFFNIPVEIVAKAMVHLQEYVQMPPVIGTDNETKQNNLTSPSKPSLSKRKSKLSVNALQVE